MLNLNRIEVIGNLTRDPELTYLPSGQGVGKFSIATNRRYRDQEGNWVDSAPEYHEVVAWAALGENCNKVLKKGDRVFVSGRLQTRSWEAQDGSKRYRTELIADTVIGPDQVNKFSGGDDSYEASESSAPKSSPKSAPKKGATKQEDAGDSEEINIDDIPF